MLMIIQFDVEDLHHVVGLGPVEAVILLLLEQTLNIQLYFCEQFCNTTAMMKIITMKESLKIVNLRGRSHRENGNRQSQSRWYLMIP